MEERKPLVSVIVPVYNVYPYLRDCVQSVQAQSYQNWELLLVMTAQPMAAGNFVMNWLWRMAASGCSISPMGGSLMPGTLGCNRRRENIFTCWTAMT